MSAVLIKIDSLAKCCASDRDVLVQRSLQSFLATTHTKCKNHYFCPSLFCLLKLAENTHNQNSFKSQNPSMSNSGVYFVRNKARVPNSARNRGKKDFHVLSTLLLSKPSC